MPTAVRNVAHIGNRLALAIALAVALSIPLAYGLVAWRNFSGELEFKARVKATALDGLIATIPDLWPYAENRLLGLLAREPVRLEGESVHVHDAAGQLVTQVGETPPWPTLTRSYALYDAGRVVGSVKVTDTLRGVLVGLALAALAGLALGAGVNFLLRAYPLRALRRATGELFEQKQHAEFTLNSIGEAVIATDAAGRVEFMNPVAESLTGWSLEEARGRLAPDILPLVDAHTDNSVATALTHALAEKAAMCSAREIDLVRRDASRIGIGESASPIFDADGQITGGVLVFRDVSVNRAAARRSAWAAMHDVLTGLANRREFENRVQDAVDSARRAGRHHVVCFMDLDQFKTVNDTCGHAAGDDLLREVAAILLPRIRKSDTLARLGGDEFGILLDNCTLERGQFIAADVLAAIGEYRFHRDGKAFAIGMSIGIAAVTGESASCAEVMSRADAACYWAKEQGRHRASVYREGDGDMAARRRETGWIARINHALAQDRFTLHHQAYRALDPADGEREHIEVFLRMIDDDGSLIPPGSFLAAAERHNLMPAIDRWVVGTVMARFDELVARRGGRPITCAINLSGSSMVSADFLDFLRLVVREHPVPPRSICFEITEAVAAGHLRQAGEFMLACRHLGFLLALDDFGTGLVSLGYLKRLPVDYLKIDGGFVRNVEHDAVDKAMTETINRVGHAMGIRTVAENAESEGIIETLRGIGVDYAQGYGVGLPAPLFDEPVAGAARRGQDLREDATPG